jgi:hypothetical protein
MTDTLNPTPHSPAADDRFSIIGTNVPAADSRPVGADDRAVIGVFADLDSAQAAVERLAAAGFPIDHVSVLGKDLQSETRFNGYVTTGDIAGPSAATGAWVGGLFGLLAGTALLFVPGAGPLIVLGPLAAASIGAVQGALVAGGVGAILGHFVAKQHIPKYEQLVKAGSYLVVVHGAEQDVARAQQVLTDAGSSDVQRHDKYRGSAIMPISQAVEGMRVFDAARKEVGKVEFVKLGDSEAITTLGEETDNGEPRVAGELRERLLRLGFIKVDRRGVLKSDAYVASDEIDRVQDGAVHLTVTDREMLKEADS